ncbi:hypothetical protein T09_3774 [Trichinella sp. T9]|nr:hypothetical protein T09_3774 [Trichinella sp. T9]
MVLTNKSIPIDLASDPIGGASTSSKPNGRSKEPQQMAKAVALSAVLKIDRPQACLLVYLFDLRQFCQTRPDNSTFHSFTTTIDHNSSPNSTQFYANYATLSAYLFPLAIL